MRNIKYIVLHCTATSPHATIESIQAYWRNTFGWKSPGYHYIISANGGVKQLQDEALTTNGVKGYNNNSIHISYIGGLDPANPKKGLDTRTPEQLKTMKDLVRKMKAKYPAAKILGHRDFSPDKNGNGKIDSWEWVEVCPSFDVATWLLKEGI